MTDKYVCVSLTKVSLCAFVSSVIWPKMLSLAITLLLLLLFSWWFPGCFGVSRTHRSIRASEKCRGWWKLCKSFFTLCDICMGANLHSRSPCGYVAVSWALLPWQKHGHLKGLEPSLCYLFFFFFVYSSPFLFWVTCSFFPLSPFQSGTLLYPPNPISFLALSPLSTSPLYLSLVIIECSYRIWVK